MEKLVNQSKRWMATLGAFAFLMVAGWQVGAGGTGEVFSETEVALENAVAGSGNECPLKIDDPQWTWGPNCGFCIIWYNDCFCGPGYC